MALKSDYVMSSSSTFRTDGLYRTGFSSQSAYDLHPTFSSILKEAEAGLPVKELCQKCNIADATFYTRRKKYGGLEASEARRLKALEEENARLKKLLAESMLDTEALKAALNRKY